MQIRSMFGFMILAMGTCTGLDAQDLGSKSLQAPPATGNTGLPGLPLFNSTPSALPNPILPSRSVRDPMSSDSPMASPINGFSQNTSSSDEDPIKLRFPEMVKSKAKRQIAPNGKVQEVDVITYEMREISIPKDVNLDEFLEKNELSADGKRLAGLTVTARRHDKLLQALMDAKSEEEKSKAAKELEENYTIHYGIESWWRAEKLKELEKRLEEMRAQVKTRVDSEKKYVDAAMTIANLHAQGISIAPPRPALPDTYGQGGYDPQSFAVPQGFPSGIGTPYTNPQTQGTTPGLSAPTDARY